MKIIAQNKKAFFDYEVLDRIEAGIVLTGDEVKSLRAGHINLTGSFAHVHNAELYVVNMHIAPYSHAYSKSEEQTRRSRKLLVHKKELNRLIGEISQKGTTLIPLKIYFNEKGIVKLELGICKHKKAFSQKAEKKEKDIERQTRRELKKVYKY
ncbi:SsrA-binding protein SmpB [Candidatus Dependentiae bacterium]|nr:SsrA-binding protein SmpB [Candidatus Dependentiae bacterium]